MLKHRTLTVIVSAGQSRNPKKRELESSVAELASKIPGVRVVRVPHLYDLPPGGETYSQLGAIDDDLIVIGWLYDRATHWILDRNGVTGQPGQVELLAPDKLEDDDDDAEATAEEELERVTDIQPRQDRDIYCIEFRASEKAEDFAAEIERIVGSSELDAQPRGTPLTLETLTRFEEPTNDTFVGSPSLASQPAIVDSDAAADEPPAELVGVASVTTIEEASGRRWYPVIDFSRCTNCMECIDFCLFGVYGVNTIETIVVEQPDNCRKGCPACSRVCPQNAIIFPQHKTPAIAGAPVEAGGLKIDLSKLFGAPESDEDAAEVAARERDEQLILAGRKPLAGQSELEQRIAASKKAKPDELDSLIDELDALDL